MADDDRDGAIRAFASWLRPGGVLVADVRDWVSTTRRYADHPGFERTIEHDRGALTFRSSTSLNVGEQALHIEEQFVGTIHGDAIDDRSSFTMRCWTADELEDRVARAGFANLEFVPDPGDGRQPDRLVVVAEL